MAIQLSKGQGINLSKDHGLTHALVKVTWDLDPAHPVQRHEMDMNVAAFELTHASGKAVAPDEKAFVFYNNADSFTGAIHHDPDGANKGDDEMHIDFAKLLANPHGVDEISCIVEIYEGLKRGHHFGQFKHCTAHIINPDSNETIAEFKLTDDDSNATAVQMGSFIIKDGHVHFEAVGTGYQKGLADFLAVYGLAAADEE